MLKIVVFDSGYGGELFADQLEETLPIVKVIRVIDWRNADKYQKHPRTARRAAIVALKPYLGRADLIIVANYYLSITSLKYFRRKYREQKFIGLKLPEPDLSLDRRPAALTTRALARTINYRNYLLRFKRHHLKTICLDHWVTLVDDGELTYNMVYRDFEKFRRRYHHNPNEFILMHSSFTDTAPLLKEINGKNIKIHDGFKDCIVEACKTLKIRGGIGKKNKGKKNKGNKNGNQKGKAKPTSDKKK